MELLVKIAAGAVTAALCAVVLRRNSVEFAVLIVLVTGVWVLFMTMQALGEAVGSLVRLADLAGLDIGLVEPVVKVVGLSVVAKSAAEVCKAAGEGGIAGFVELAGTILALAAALPLVNAVVEMIAGLLV
ncbi:MAG: stage III sporulation protein AD [Ruminococcaceae bacterium]|nr:stage III sporulation protein AD [Oscillospiraceae bacterium]